MTTPRRPATSLPRSSERRARRLPVGPGALLAVAVVIAASGFVVAFAGSAPGTALPPFLLVDTGHGTTPPTRGHGTSTSLVTTTTGTPADIGPTTVVTAIHPVHVQDDATDNERGDQSDGPTTPTSTSTTPTTATSTIPSRSTTTTTTRPGTPHDDGAGN